MALDESTSPEAEAAPAEAAEADVAPVAEAATEFGPMAGAATESESDASGKSSITAGAVPLRRQPCRRGENARARPTPASAADAASRGVPAGSSSAEPVAGETSSRNRSAASGKGWRSLAAGGARPKVLIFLEPNRRRKMCTLRVNACQ